VAGNPEPSGDDLTSADSLVDRPTLPPAPPEDVAEAATRPPRAAFVAAAPSTQAPAAELASASPPPSSPGGYEILAELGRGGMGVVYKARQTALQRTVALKMILSGGHASDTDLARFRTEAESIARLQHPHIVQIHEIGVHDGLPYFSLEFCGGGNLDGKLAGKPLPARAAAALLEKLAHAVQAAHDKGVIHRDLKPANVLLAEDGTPKITDFGLAKKLISGLEGSALGPGLTQSGSIMGTPSYMAPEQAGGKSKELGPACDVYALGAVLYECLTGRPPFLAATPLDTVLQVVSDEPVPPSRLNKKVPRDLETICLKCLEKDSRRRYPSAQTLAEDLQRFQAGEPIKARPAGLAERAVKWVRRRPLVAGLLAVVCLVTVVGVIAFAWAFGQAIEGRDTALAALDQADKARRKAERLLFISQIAQAQKHLENNDLVNCQLALDGCPPDYHGRAEYGFLVNYTERKARILLSRAVLISISDDGKRLAWGGSSYTESPTIKVWDMEAGKQMLSLRSNNMVLLALSADGKKFFFADGTGGIKEWGVDTNKQTATLEGHAAFTGLAAVSADGKRLFSWSDKTIKVWDLVSGKAIRTIAHRSGNLVTDYLAASRNGKRLISVGSGVDGTNIWDVDTGRIIPTLTEEMRRSTFRSILSGDGKWLFSGKDSSIEVWNLESGQKARTLPPHNGAITCLALSGDGKWLLSGTRNGFVTLCEVQTGQVVATMRGHEKVSRVALSADGKRFVSAGKNIRLWNLDARQESRSLTSNSGDIRCLGLTDDAKQLCSVDAGHSGFKVWDLHAGKVSYSLSGHRGAAVCMALSRDAKRLVSAEQDHTIRVWDLVRRKEAFTLGSHKGVFGLELSSDGSRLVSAGKGSTFHIKVWDLEARKEGLTSERFPRRDVKLFDHISCLALSNDGKRCFVENGGLIWWWDLESEIVFPIGRHGASCLVLSHDGKRLVSGGAGSFPTITVWDTSRASPALSPDDRAVFSSVGTIKDPRTGYVRWSAEILVLRGHSASVTCLALSENGELFSGSEDGAIKVWDLSAGKETLTLSGHPGGVSSLALSRDGKRLVSAGRDKTIKVWSLAPLSHGRARTD
jgi:WD40 repeat protein